MPNSLSIYEQRKQAINILHAEIIKNEDATCNYMEAYNELYAFDDRYNRNENDEYRSNTNLAALISKMKTLDTHITTVMGKVDSFKANLMQLIEALEKNLTNMEEEVAQEQSRERRNVSEMESNYIIMPNSLSIYEQRKQAIQILYAELIKNENAVMNYMEAYEALYGFDENNNNDEYRSNTNLAGLISEMKTLHSHVTTVTGKIDSFKAHLMQLIEALDKNLKNMEEEDA